MLSLQHPPKVLITMSGFQNLAISLQALIRSISLHQTTDLQILITRKRTNCLQYSVCASARSYLQGIAFLQTKFKSKLI
jgi:hypothetical protein